MAVVVQSLLALWSGRTCNRRVLFSAIFPCRYGVLSAVLGQFSQAYPESLNIVQVDNERFHKSQDLVVPKNIILLLQPPYCPELNPME